MKRSIQPVIHILPNAHLDPVWLWDWREGLNEGVTTIKTVLELMDEFPELTFFRGEAVIYKHLKKTAPALFNKMRERMEEGRWDVVGGMYVQPDSNLSSVETLCRHFERSLEYFEKEVGVRPTISWQADSFGHTAGWPNILTSFGMEGFCFTRPQRGQFPMESPAFWWNSDHDANLLCYRQHWPWYCSERSNVPQMLDETLKGLSSQSFQNVGALMGLGNHGGGPTRRHLLEIEAWRQKHPEVIVKYSTLTGFFKELRKEIAGRKELEIPVFKGEMGFCLRGCYSSVQKFKTLFRHAETAVVSAEIAQSVLSPSGSSATLDEAWDSVLFNSFHDILPGTSIERAMEDQMLWTGMAIHRSQETRFDAMNQLAARVDTRVPAPESIDRPTDVPLLLWNPLPREFHGPVEIEASLDYRPIMEYQHCAHELPFALREANGETIPFQTIDTEHGSMTDVPWRKRVVAQLTIPPMGWKVVRMGLAKQKFAAAPRESDCLAQSGDTPHIANFMWEVGVDAENNLVIKKEGRPFLASPLSLLTVDDPWGSWGGMNEDPASYCLNTVREKWTLKDKQILESGPERSRLWTRWKGGDSWVDLTFDLCRDTPWISINGRMLWNERSARLQLVIPSTGTATCDVPGSVVERDTCGQVPVGRWFYRVNQGNQRVGLASDVFSDTDFQSQETRLTLARATRYGNDVPTLRDEKLWQPATDCGELKFRLALFTDGADPDHVTDTLIHAPTFLPVTPGDGPLPCMGSFGLLSPANVRMLSLQKTGEGLKMRVQNRGNQSCEAFFNADGAKHSLGLIGSQEIVTRMIPFKG